MNPRVDSFVLVVVGDEPVPPVVPLHLETAGVICGAVRGIAEVPRDFHTHYFPFLLLW